jgi:hypothetical protein
MLTPRIFEPPDATNEAEAERRQMTAGPGECASPVGVVGSEPVHHNDGGIAMTSHGNFFEPSLAGTGRGHQVTAITRLELGA